MQYDFNVPANGGQVIDVKGKFFKYKSGTGLIRVRINKGGYVDLLPGQGVWNVDFDTLTMQDRSGAPNIGTLLAGDFDFHDDRITGTVEVVDGGKARTITNQAFLLLVNSSSIAGQNAHAELFNPAGSAKNVIIEAVTYSSSASGGIVAFMYNAALANFIAQGQSKKMGGAASVAAGYWVSNVGAIAANQSLIGAYMSANTPNTFTPKEPLVLPPGYGLVVMQTALANSLSAAFEWYEDPQ
jgi:hypothetical protein